MALNLFNILPPNTDFLETPEKGWLLFPVLPSMIASWSRVDTQLECTGLGYNCLWKVVLFQLAGTWFILILQYFNSTLSEASIYKVITTCGRHGAKCFG